MKTFIGGTDKYNNRTDEGLKDDMKGWLEYMWPNCRAEQEETTKETPDTQDNNLVRLELKRRQRRQENLTLKERDYYIRKRQNEKWHIKD